MQSLYPYLATAPRPPRFVDQGGLLSPISDFPSTKHRPGAVKVGKRSEEARVSEEAVRRKDGEGGPRKLGMGYGEAEEPV
jgi:hypothetical protein